MAEPYKPPAPLDVREVVGNAIQNGALPHIYANGFGTAQTPTDMTLVLTLNGIALCTVNMPYPIVKAMIVDLQRCISNVETAMKQEVKIPAQYGAEFQKIMTQEND